MPIEFPDSSSEAECNTYGYTYDSNCTGSDGVTLDYDQTWHAVVLNGVTAWVPLSGESSTGVDGNDGPQGATGPDGEAGSIGFQGESGPAGTNGSPGTQGPDGPAGNPGSDGADAVAPGLSFNDINVLETMYVSSTGGDPNEFTVSSTDAFTYDPSNLGALRINRIRENIQTVTYTGGLITLKGISGPAVHVTSKSGSASTSEKVTEIRLDTSGVQGSDFKAWMPGDFLTVIFRQDQSGAAFATTQFGHGDGINRFRDSGGNFFTDSEIKYGSGITTCLPFGNNQGDIDVLYINCINDVGGTIKPYFLVNHLQFHDGLT
tara:strand:+ start:597 stop:1553 length:957 start_codon:yes stop_codon:yes gene_type:complete